MNVSELDSALDVMQEWASKRLELIQEYARHKFKDDPDGYQRYQDACKRADDWIEQHPFQMPPDWEYFYNDRHPQ